LLSHLPFPTPGVMDDEATRSLVAVLNGATAYDFRYPLWGYVTKPWSLNASGLSACSKLKVAAATTPIAALVFQRPHPPPSPVAASHCPVSLCVIASPLCSPFLPPPSHPRARTHLLVPQDVFKERAARFFSAPDTEDGVRSKLLDVVCNTAFAMVPGERGPACSRAPAGVQLHGALLPGRHLPGCAGRVQELAVPRPVSSPMTRPQGAIPGGWARLRCSGAPSNPSLHDFCYGTSLCVWSLRAKHVRVCACSGCLASLRAMPVWCLCVALSCCAFCSTDPPVGKVEAALNQVREPCVLRPPLPTLCKTADEAAAFGGSCGR
jgi:hypothetical protein